MKWGVLLIKRKCPTAQSERNSVCPLLSQDNSCPWLPEVRWVIAQISCQWSSCRTWEYCHLWTADSQCVFHEAGFDAFCVGYGELAFCISINYTDLLQPVLQCWSVEPLNIETHCWDDRSLSHCRKVVPLSEVTKSHTSTSQLSVSKLRRLSTSQSVHYGEFQLMMQVSIFFYSVSSYFTPAGHEGCWASLQLPRLVPQHIHMYLWNVHVVSV